MGIGNAANTAASGLKIPAMYFRFHYFTAFAGSPMCRSVILDGCKGMNVRISRPKLKTAVDAELVFPILDIAGRNMGNNISDSGAGCASSPVTGLIRMSHILVFSGAGTTIAAAVTNLITIGGVPVIVGISDFSAFGADLPVLILIVELFTAGFMTTFHYKPAILTGRCTTVRKVMFCMTDPAAAIRAACPMVEIIILPGSV